MSGNSFKIVFLLILLTQLPLSAQGDPNNGGNNGGSNGSGNNDEEEEDGGIGEILRDIGEASIPKYMSPFPTWVGAGMNSGWSNTSKTTSMFGLPVGITLVKINQPLVAVGSLKKSFDFKGKVPLRPVLKTFIEDNGSDGLTLDSIKMLVQAVPGNENLEFDNELDVDLVNVPTMVGEPKRPKYSLDSLFQAGAPNTYQILKEYNKISGNEAMDLSQEVELPFQGLVGFPSDFMLSLPGVGTEFSIGKIPILNNFTLGFRFFPTLPIGDFGEVGLLGISFEHEFTRLIPVVNLIPFIHVSAQYAFYKLHMGFKEFGELNLNNNLMMLKGSADIKFFKVIGLGAYGGMGYELTNLHLKINASEEMKTPEFEVDVPGDNGFRIQVGGRLSLSIFDFYADMTTGEATVFNLGLAIGINGL